MKTKMVLLVCAAWTLCGLSGVLASEDAVKIYFSEDFRNYADTAAGVVGEGLTVGNDPVWASTAELNIRAVQDGLVFASFIAAPALNQFDVLFHFRFLNAGAQGSAFEVVLLDTENEQTVISFLNTINSSGMSQLVISVDGLSGTAPVLPNGAWEEAAIQVDGETLRVFITKDRVMQEIVSLPFFRALDGFNFMAYNNQQFSLRNIVLRDNAPLPAYPAAKHFADFRSRTQPLDNPVTASSGQVVTLTPSPHAGIVLKLGVNASNVVTLKVKWDSGKIVTYPIGVEGYTHKALAPVVGKAKGEILDLPDAILSTQFARYYVRPNIKRYHSSYSVVPQYIDLIRDWNNLPKASEHPFHIDFAAQLDGGLHVFFDGSYVQTLRETGAAIADVSFAFNAPVQYTIKSDRYASIDASAFCMLDLSANPRAKAFADAALSLLPGVQFIDDIPFDVAKPMDSADVEICKQGMGNWALEVDEYHGRSPLDGFPSAIHFRLPAVPYVKAYVLLAMDPDPNKVKVLTTRLGHYINNGSGGNRVGDTVIEILGNTVPSHFTQVGQLTLEGQTIPLYQVEIPLALGDILDIPARRAYIDFEFIGQGWINTEQLDKRMKPDPNSDSAFNIFAVTLEKAPVQMDIQQRQPGNVFTEDEPNPMTTVTLKAMQTGAMGTVDWVATDTDGHTVFQGSEAFSFVMIGETAEVDIAFGNRPVGFYDLAIRMLDATGRVLITHPARFAILSEDTRQANKDASPYATWWFDAHGSPGDMDIGGPIMQKAGIRKASWVKLMPEAQATYNIRGPGSMKCPPMSDFNTTTGKFKNEAAFKLTITQALAKDPTIDHILIWHESGPSYGIPEELLNLVAPAPTVKSIDQAAYVNEAGRLIREVAPQLKIQIGNSSASIGSVVLPLRAGADPQYYDFIGIETPSQVIRPERLQEVGLQGMVISKAIGNYLVNGQKEMKLNGTMEFTYRCERDMGEQQQAEWYMRDVLISLANNFFLISPAILFDCNTAYYNSLWGGSGMLKHAPYVYPKRAYVAYAALTKALDRVTFSRQIPTGSTTVYAIEFSRADGTFATALWASRGAVMFALDVPSGTATVTEMYGKTDVRTGNEITVNGGEAPVYVVTDSPLGAVSIAGRSFPKGQVLAEKARLGARFDDISKVELDPDLTMESTHTKFLPILKPSTFSIQQVNDEEKGECIEVTLDVSTDPYQSAYITEYTTLRLKEPALIPGKPEVIGVWIKGNSNWGQIRFEIEDANGEVFKNLSTGKSWGCDVMDWPGNLAVDFDGWGYVYQTLFPTTLVNDHSPGPYSEQWVSEGGDKKIDLPIKIRALTIGMNRTKLDLLDFKPTAPSIRIKHAGGIEHREPRVSPTMLILTTR